MLSPKCRDCGGVGSLLLGVEGLESHVEKVGLYSGTRRSRV